MDIYLSILVIIFAIIAFLIVYYLTSHPDDRRKESRLPLNRLDFEAGEDIGLDVDIFEPVKIDKEKSHKENYQEQEDYPLKEKYNDTYIRLLVRDPEYLYTYWEVEDKAFYNNPYLRLVKDDDNSKIDIKINDNADSWYLKVEPDTSYRLEIGYKVNEHFYLLASSNSVKTPLHRPSDIVDEHWMTIEELSKYIYRIEMDSLEIIKNIEQRRIEEEFHVDSYSFLQK